MAKKKATAKKATAKRAAPKPPAPKPVAGQFKDVSWEWLESEGKLSLRLDPQRPVYSLQIDFGREILSAECSLGGSSISPKVVGSAILLKCNNGPFEAIVKLADGKAQNPALSAWLI